jgi:16S rRNA C967 or C1407 C5-methylase (RsmB/RsmF family)
VALLIDKSLQDSLKRVYHGRLERVLEALGGMGPRYYFRLNSLAGSAREIIESMGARRLDVRRHETIPDTGFLLVKKENPSIEGTPVVADRFAAEAVMQGAHLYAPGVKNCKGLRLGMEASVRDKSGTVVGSGLARQGETAILSYHRGIAIETLKSRFQLPALRESSWYNNGMIHLQSLPSMVACRVLDPKPGEVVVDLNCSPAGKMSYLCQLSENKAKIFGFDRNEQKIEKAREHLERLLCKNYQLIAHDSRYAHLDYTLRADKVLVDPPCTGLGVMPKLSIDATMVDVKNLAAYQMQFLRAAAGIIKKGGTVVYSVCTITLEECEEMVTFATDELGLVEIEAYPIVARNAANGTELSQRFDPELDGAGYFVAKFVKP